MPILVTTATSQRSKPRPSRSRPPRAVSNTAASTSGWSKNFFCTLGAAAVAGINALSLDIDTVSTGHADAHALAFEDIGDKANRSGLAIGSGDRHNRDTPSSPFLNMLRNDRFPNRPPLPERRLQMHAKARSCINFDNGAMSFQRL